MKEKVNPGDPYAVVVWCDKREIIVNNDVFSVLNKNGPRLIDCSGLLSVKYTEKHQCKSQYHPVFTSVSGAILQLMTLRG